MIFPAASCLAILSCPSTPDRGQVCLSFQPAQHLVRRLLGWIGFAIQGRRKGYGEHRRLPGIRMDDQADPKRIKDRPRLPFCANWPLKNKYIRISPDAMVEADATKGALI